MSYLACLYLALAVRAAGAQLSRPLIEEFLSRLGSPRDDEFLEALFRLLQPVIASPRETVVSPALPPSMASDKSARPPVREETSENSPLEQDDGSEGRYLYGVVKARGPQADLGVMGVDGNPVFLIRERDVAAIVHACPPEPYQSDDPQKVTEWLQAHQSVLETAMGKWGTVIPSGFDTILKGVLPDPDEVVREWLRDTYDQLERTWQRIEGKGEYDVGIGWDAGAAERWARASSREIGQLEAGLASLSPGLAYLERQRLETLVAEVLENACSDYARRFLQQISSCCAETKVEAMAKIGQDEHVVLKVACLATPGEAESLGTVLDEIALSPGFAVRFTGPWPPFAFVD